MSCHLEYCVLWIAEGVIECVFSQLFISGHVRVPLYSLYPQPPQYRGQISLLEGVEHDSEIKKKWGIVVRVTSTAFQAHGLLISTGPIDIH